MTGCADPACERSRGSIEERTPRLRPARSLLPQKFRYPVLPSLRPGRRDDPRGVAGAEVRVLNRDGSQGRCFRRRFFYEGRGNPQFLLKEDGRFAGDTDLPQAIRAIAGDFQVDQDVAGVLMVAKFFEIQS